MSTKRDRKRRAILESLRGASAPLSSAQLSERLTVRGFDVSERTVRLYLADMHAEGLTEAVGRRVVFEGMSRFELEGDLIRRYTEQFDRGLALTQLGFPPERIAKAVRRAAERQNAKPEIRPHLTA